MGSMSDRDRSPVAERLPRSNPLPPDALAIAEARQEALEAERTAAIAGMVARNQCCADASAEAGRPVTCNQHVDWWRIRWMIHGIGGGYARHDDAA
jgi:hypothetical protein